MGLLSKLKSLAWKTAPAPPVNQGGGGHGVSFADISHGIRAPRADELVAECLGTAYTCSTLNADLVASTPMRLFVKTAKGQKKSRLSERGKTRKVSKSARAWLAKSPQSSAMVAGADDVEEVVDHPILDLLRNPAGDSEIRTGQSQYEFIETVQRYLEIVGLCYVWCPTNGLGVPSQLWILPPQYTKLTPDGKQYQFAGGSSLVYYPVDEVIPFRMPDLADPYKGGKSPMQACFEQVMIFRLFNSQTEALLRNGARPDAMWSPKGDSEGSGIGKPEAKRMALAMRQAYSQAGRGGVFISEIPGSLQPLTWATNEVLPPETANMLKTQIANCFQVPTTKLDRADSTLASAATGDYAHAKDAGLPRCTRLASTLNNFLLPLFDPDRRLFFAFDSCVPEDDVARASQMKDGVTLGAVLRDEYRDAVGLPSEEWAKTPLAPNTMLPVDEQGNPIRPAPVPTDPSMPPTPDKAVKRLPSVVNATDSGKARSLPPDTQLETAIAGVFEQQRRELLAVIAGEGVKSIVQKDETGEEKKRDLLPILLSALNAWTARMPRAVQPAIEAIVRQEGTTLLLQVQANPAAHLAFDEATHTVANRLASELGKAVTQTTADRLTAEVRSALAEQPALPAPTPTAETPAADPQADAAKRVSDAVNKVFDEATGARAKMIARTESSRATHTAEVQAAKQSGVVRLKKWLASADCCDVCEQIAADNADGIPLSKTFAEFGGKYGSIQCPPAHPNCVCSLTYVTTDALGGEK